MSEASNVTYQDKIYKLLHQCSKDYYKPDLHSFSADIANGTVYVDCRGREVYIKTSTYDDSGNEKTAHFTGTILAATNRLELLGIDLLTVEI